MDRDADRGFLGGCDVTGEVGGEVALGEDDHGRRAALPRERDQPLEAADVQAVGEGRDGERDVEVRSEHLLDGLVARDLADEGGVAGEHGLDRAEHARRAGAHADPVAGDGQAAAAGLVAEAAGRAARALAFVGLHHERAALLDQHAAGHEALLAERREVTVELVVPAEWLEGHS